MKKLMKTVSNLRIRTRHQQNIVNENTKENKDPAEAEDNDEYEYCILCRKKTNVLKDTPVDLRDYYVHGGGQLCMECAVSLLNVN